jgi:hypothetical protein
MNQPFSVSSTLHWPAGRDPAAGIANTLPHRSAADRAALSAAVDGSPVLPRYLTNSVSVSHLVEFMCTWCRSVMYSLYTFFASTRLKGCLCGDVEKRRLGLARASVCAWQAFHLTAARRYAAGRPGLLRS